MHFRLELTYLGRWQIEKDPKLIQPPGTPSPQSDLYISMPIQKLLQYNSSSLITGR